MLLHRPRTNIHTKSFSSKASSKPISIHWRTQLKQSQLVSQISSTLLERNNWAAVLLPLSLSSSISPPIFLRILHKTKTYPQLSLTFFNWAKSNLGFKPDLKTICKLAQVLIGAGLTRKSGPLLGSLIQTYPPTQIVNSAIEACRGTNFQSPVLGAVVECYCKNGFPFEALVVYKKAFFHGFILSIRSCNVLLDASEVENETRLAWCLYGNMLRNGILPDRFTWNLIARLLCKDGKFDKIVRILDMGIHNSLLYNLVIDFYSKRGDFRAAFGCLNAMHNRKIVAGFSIYSSILDGACKHGDNKVIEMITNSMVDEGLIPSISLSFYDLIIQKLSEFGRTYAINMFLVRAFEGRTELSVASHICMLMAFSKEGRVKEAIRTYHEIVSRDIQLDRSCYIEFVNALCNEDPSDETGGLLKDIIGKGDISMCITKLSSFVSKQCDKRRWRDAEELLNAMLDKEMVPGSSCCSSLVLHYCNSRRIDLAIGLNERVEKLQGVLDVKAYNVLMRGLMKEKRVEEAIKVFDYMGSRKLMNVESFCIMIEGLARGNELRKAMKMHDEMLREGLKPDQKRYKRLILCFK